MKSCQIKDNYYCQVEKALSFIPANEENNNMLMIQIDSIPDGTHSERYNESYSNNVAIILVKSDNRKRNIVLYATNKSQPATTNESHDSLKYKCFCIVNIGVLSNSQKVNFLRANRQINYICLLIL